MSRKNYSTIVSLHRPFHSQLWVARWVCEYIHFYSSQDAARIDSVDFFFFFINRLKRLYAKNENIQEYVSRSTVDEVCSYFNQYKTMKEKREVLDSIMHSPRSEQIEKHVYSLYKASTYAVNLAEDKLGLIRKNHLTEAGEKLHLQKKPSVGVRLVDRVVYLRQILTRDFYFFVPFCMLQWYSKERMQPESAIFDFSEKYHKVSRFDYTHCSHDNYTKVRMQWINQLNILTENKRIRDWATKVIIDQYASQYNELQTEIKEFVKDQKKNIKSSDKLDVLYEAYSSLVGTSDGSGYVNLYDIMSKIPKMGYNKFNNLLQTYYEQRNRKENIFLINIIATLDLRKRFVVRGKPVMKIKIQR